MEVNSKILLGMWDNLGRTAAEYPHLRRICAKDSGRIEVVNGEFISALAHDDQPGILFGGHFCNWEIGPYTLRRLLGLTLASVYRAPKQSLGRPADPAIAAGSYRDTQRR